MRQKLDLAALYGDALACLPKTLNGAPPPPVPIYCPVTLAELLAEAVTHGRNQLPARAKRSFAARAAPTPSSNCAAKSGTPAEMDVIGQRAA